MKIEPIQFTKEVELLLMSENLPVSDLSESPNTKLFGIKMNTQIVGLVGVDQKETIGLLRSLVVRSDIRSKGYGKQLIDYAEAWASKNGVGKLYLLTTTAADYFVKIGFTNISRDKAPSFIANTPQFSNLCPSSAEFMCKNISPTRRSI